MRIPEAKVNEIYNAVDIVTVVADYLSLKKKGQNYWALSPFTTEKTPSFSVSASKGIYKCFSTGKGGNAVNFLMEMEGYSYPEALKTLAKKFNIEVEEEEETEDQRLSRDKRDSLFIVNEFASRFFHEQLMETEEGKNIGLSYFKERGILKTTIEEFQLGYSPNSWEAFTLAAKQQQYQDEYLKELGLSGTSEKSGRLYDRFRGRIMFPITNAVGKVVGFGGRVLTSEKQMAKYINSPESSLYNKSQVLYGLSHAKQHIRNEDLCILTEGYMDTIVLHQSGIKNVVASSGTALTNEQIRLIRRFTKNVLMIYDGDAAGVKAALRGIDLLVEEHMAPRVLVLPDNHDPDSYVNEFGTTAFLEFSKEKAMTFLDFKQDILTNQLDISDPQQLAEMIRSLADTLSRIPDDLQRQLYIKHTAGKVGISEDLMAQAVIDAEKSRSKWTKRESHRESPSQSPPPAEVRDAGFAETLDLASQEKELLRILINYHDKILDIPGEAEDGEEPPPTTPVPLVTFFAQEMEGLTFQNTVLESIKKEILTANQKDSTFHVHRLLNHEDPAIGSLVTELLLIPSVSKNWKKLGIIVQEYDSNTLSSVNKAILHYKRKKIGKLMDEVKESFKNATPEKEKELDTMWMYLMKVFREVNQKLGSEGGI
ncbi:DNA primase [bacterium]|nr:DNA primase [bacterium]